MKAAFQYKTGRREKKLDRVPIILKAGISFSETIRMLPASRTPDGDFFRCPICAAENLVLGSDPPGDSVCPSCGAHGWIEVTPVADASLSRRCSERQRKQWQLDDLALEMQQAKSLDEVGDHLVKFLAGSLEAYGANVWIEFQTGWWLKKKTFSLVATAGMCHTSKFAKQVFQSQRSLMRPIHIQKREVIYLGTPLRGSERVIGVLELLQRAEESPDSLAEDLALMKKAVMIAQDSRAVRECEFGWDKMLTPPMSAARG
jgi:hypothetical protein